MSPFYFCLIVVILSPALASAPAAAVAASSISASAVHAPTVPTAQQFLRVHNEARAAVGVPPLSWNGTLLLDATRYAAELHRDCEARATAQPWSTDRVYGRNIFKGYGRRSGADTVAFWVEEGKRWYDRDGADRCMAAAAPPERSCGSYTQVVWRATTQLGCARRTCVNGVDTVAVCEYYPQGNYVGQRPY